MKVFISADMEGVAGVSDWDQCRVGAPAYAEGCRLLLGEVNAAVEGAAEAGAPDVLVNDSHGLMANLAPDQLAASAAYLSGRHKPLYMMEGLDATFDAVVYVGYHGAMPTPSVLSHTYNPRAVSDVRIGGIRAGESGINALVAAAYAVPVVCITGDQYVGPEAEPFCPGLEHVVVKESVSRGSARSRHPREAQDLIRAGVSSALRTTAARQPPRLTGSLETDWLTTDMAAQAALVRGVSRAGERTTVIEVGDDPLGCYRAFVATLAITRPLSTAD
jgi:D-amino peptidase